MGEFSKGRTISDRLSEIARVSFIGRQNELAVLSDAVESDPPPFVVAFIHGPGGIGKSYLIQALLDSLGSEVRRYVLDCRNIEPTQEGLFGGLGTALEIEEEPNHHSIIDCLRDTGQRLVLALDTYETFALMDTWLRQVFVPSLPENVFTIFAGRQAPNRAWLTTPGWKDLFREIELREFSDEDVHKMMESRGLTPPQIERVQRFARGYPLVLEMGASSILAQPDLEISHGPPPEVLEQLTKAFLSGLPAEIMETVEAASTVRCVTEPLLRALLDISDVRERFNNLQGLPFIDVTVEGLNFHDVVHDTISKDLAWRDPNRYHTYRRRAWRFISKESHQPVARTLWQCTADMIYLIENPVIRDAFFPKGATDYIVEPAAAGDGGDIIDITSSTEPEESARLIRGWWEAHPEIFSAIKSQDGELAAFFVLFEPSSVDHQLLADDPVTAAYLRHLSEDPIADGERVLFLRRWLDRTVGEAPSPTQGAAWLDIKRWYMELRPSLRRIYACCRDRETYEPIVTTFTFKFLDHLNVTLGGSTYHTVFLDFGPSSVDGWLATLVGEELGMESTKAEVTVTEHGRLLVTVLFTDIVGSTERAAQLGDSGWRDLVESHHAIVRGELSRFQGREIDTAGDGFFAAFDSPAQGIKCACAINDAVRQLGIDIRAGLHLSECEEIGGSIRGIGVHVGARVAALAGAGEVLVSRTITDAVAGSNIRFEDRGKHVLKGIPGERRLFAVELRSVSSKS